MALYRDRAVPSPTKETVKQLSDKLGFQLDDSAIADYQEALSRCLEDFDKILDIPDCKLPVKYPRTPGYRPTREENSHNAWFWKCEINGAALGKLRGKRIVIKDNICVAGIPMSMGSHSLPGYVPDEDATVVTRVLDAGGTIVGKAVCEELSISGSSFTAATGPVMNPLDNRRETGGSSSGCGALLASGEVDMAIGGDQGGSVRHPSSRCGLVGLKPTYGLVPYTGACPCEVSLDHLGPMARSVKDVSLLLEVIAGYDEGRDVRQSQLHRHGQLSYSQLLNGDISGIRIGLLREGFGHQNSEEDVDRIVKEASIRLAERTGHEVVGISVPMHLQGFGMSAKGHYSTSLHHALSNGMRPGRNSLSSEVKLGVLLGEYLHESSRDVYYSKAQNLAMKLGRDYDDALTKADVLVMPTNPMKARLLPTKETSVKDLLGKYGGHNINTCPFDLTGHPALSINAGLSDGLPVGLMIVGKKYDEETILRVAYAFESIRDKTLPQ
ncbi:amidase isoform X2 [Nematostella vectensis]|uniref:amidase isoform X2 n=1 Tax=Nematostella vectensis TaxID=45351 RepID=UPI00207715D9|nr:amidase isoform X2 [Nematostella vectensis]